MKTLGVIGGLGPMATALFMKMVVEMTDASSDQEHIEMIVYNVPSIPDRTRYILGESKESPVPEMIKIGQILAAQKVNIIAIPCITASYFYSKLVEEIDSKIISIVDELCEYALQRGIRCVGLLATTGTIRSGIFQKALENVGCRLVLPSQEGQKKIMHVIYDNIKANEPVELECFFQVTDELKEEGAEVIILGCTELSVLCETYHIGAGYLDAMRVMAKCAVEYCGHLRTEYEELITTDGE